MSILVSASVSTELQSPCVHFTHILSTRDRCTHVLRGSSFGMLVKVSNPIIACPSSVCTSLWFNNSCISHDMVSARRCLFKRFILYITQRRIGEHGGTPNCPKCVRPGMTHAEACRKWRDDEEAEEAAAAAQAPAVPKLLASPSKAECWIASSV